MIDHRNYTQLKQLWNKRLKKIQAWTKGLFSAMNCHTIQGGTWGKGLHPENSWFTGRCSIKRKWFSWFNLTCVHPCTVWSWFCYRVCFVFRSRIIKKFPAFTPILLCPGRVVYVSNLPDKVHGFTLIVADFGGMSVYVWGWISEGVIWYAIS